MVIRKVIENVACQGDLIKVTTITKNQKQVIVNFYEGESPVTRYKASICCKRVSGHIRAL